MFLLFLAGPNLDFNKDGPAFYLSTTVKEAKYWMTKKCVGILEANNKKKKRKNEKPEEAIVGAILVFVVTNAKEVYKK
jgi:hypothetical protein